MLFEFWLKRAKGGDDQSATFVLKSLASSLRNHTETELQREHVASALDRVADAPPGPARVKACKQFLLLGRRPGRIPPYKAEEAEWALAQAVFDKVGGTASGAELDAAGAQVAAEMGIGHPANDAPDLRRIKTAYRKHRKDLLEIQKIGRQSNSDNGRPLG